MFFPLPFLNTLRTQEEEIVSTEGRLQVIFIRTFIEKFCKQIITWSSLSVFSLLQRKGDSFFYMCSIYLFAGSWLTPYLKLSACCTGLFGPHPKSNINISPLLSYRTHFDFVLFSMYHHILLF